MRFFTEQHKYYCGCDLHAKTMYLCVLDDRGKIVLQRNIKTEPEIFLQSIAQFREDIVVGEECMFCWYWLADLCAREGICFVIGHALYMKAISGGKAKNDKIDAHKIATLLRGGSFPIAYVYPPKMRATRDLLRRRTYVVRQRGSMITHVKNTFAQYNLPDPEQNISRKSERDGVAELIPDESARRSVRLDLDLLVFFDKTLLGLEQEIVRMAKEHDADSYARIRSVPGIGRILGLVIL